jgi:hypothetical protein
LFEQSNKNDPDLLLFKEPTEQKPFVLAETNEKGQDSDPKRQIKRMRINPGEEKMKIYCFIQGRISRQF